MELRALANRAPLIPFLKAKPTSTWVAPDGKKARVQLSVYIDRRAVEHILDAVVGPDRWTWDILQAPTMFGKDWVCHGRLSIHLPDGRVVFRDGVGTNSSGEAEMGAKGAESDALKRAAAAFGLGRALSALGNTWTGAYIGKGNKATIYNPESGNAYGKVHPEVTGAIEAWGKTLAKAAARDIAVDRDLTPDVADENPTAGDTEALPAEHVDPVPGHAVEPAPLDTPVSQTVNAAIDAAAAPPMGPADNDPVDPIAAYAAAEAARPAAQPAPEATPPGALKRVITRNADGTFTIVFAGDQAQEIAEVLEGQLGNVVERKAAGLYSAPPHAGPLLVGPMVGGAQPFGEYYDFTIQDEPVAAPSATSAADQAVADSIWAATAAANTSEPVTQSGGPVVVDGTGEVLDADAIWQETTDGDVDQRWAVLVAHHAGDADAAWTFAREKGGAKGKGGLAYGSIWRAIAAAAGKQTATQKAA